MKKITLLLLYFLLIQFAQGQTPPGNALHFDGANDYLDTGTSINNTFQGTNKITVETWVNTDANQPYQVLFGNYSSDGNISNSQFMLRLEGTNLPTFWIFANGQQNNVAALTPLPVGKWIHLACTWDGAAIKIYYNGQLQATTAFTQSFSGSGQPFRIGSNNLATFFGGKLDEFRIWDTARTQAEIRAGMTAILPGGTPGLKLYYNFDQGVAGGNNTAITSVPDLSGNGYHSAMGNFAKTGTSSNWLESYAMVVPTATAATNNYNTGFTANWTAPAIGSVDNGYRVDVSTSPTFATAIAGSPFTVSGTSLPLTGLSYNTTYYYRVRADKTSVTGQGTYSNTISAVTLCNLSTLSVQTNVTCNGGNNGTATVTASGSTGNYTYSWNTTPVQTTATATGLTAGTYSVTVTSGNCTATSSVTITQPAAIPPPTALANQVYAGTGTIANLTATGNNIQWFDSDGSAAILDATTALVNGTTYYVSQTLNGCESPRIAVTVTNISPATQTLCASPAPTVAALVSTPATGLNAQWFTPATGGNALDAAMAVSSGTYYVSQRTDSAMVSTFAGSSQGYADGAGIAAQFLSPTGVVFDTFGNMYIADSRNHKIRKITVAGGVTTFAGSSQGYADGAGTAAQFDYPYGIAIDASGNVYVAERNNNKIRKITPTGVVTTLAGSTPGYAEGTGTAAMFNDPTGVAVDASGNIYVADEGNNRIRKITPAGEVTTFAGSASGYADGTGTAAQFNVPIGVAVDAAGTVYVADYSNNKIRKITPSGMVSTLAGSTYGYADGTGATAQFSNPTGVAFDVYGNVYVADYGNATVRRITPAGVVATLAGGTFGNADGVGTAAQFAYPTGVALDASGNVYIADQANNRIRKITPQVIESNRVAVNIVVNPATPAPIAINQVFCNAATVADLEIEGDNIQWYHGVAAIDSAQQLESGTYFATQTVNGCESEQTEIDVIVTAPLILTPYTHNDVACNGDNNGSATVYATGGLNPLAMPTEMPDYMYSWAPYGGNAATAIGLAAGTYTVTVSSAAGCTATQNFIIEEPDALTASVVNQGNVLCNGGATGWATVNVTGGTGAYSYSWNTVPAQTSATANGLAAGTYIVTITDTNSCSTTKSVTITQPNILAATTTQMNVSCFNGTNGSATVTTTGGSEAYSYSWNTTPAQTSATANGLAAGTYIVTITDANSCSTTKTVTITQPNVLAATTTQTNVSCFNGTNGSATVIPTGGTGAYSYSWNTMPAQTSATANGLSAGTYIVTITDANSCSITKTVTITQPNVLAATTTQTNVSCFNGTNGSATVNVTGGTGAYSYSWNTIPVQTSATANGLSAGTYVVTITDANGCSITKTVTITQPNVLAATTTQTNVSCFNGTNGSTTVNVTGGTGAYSYSWNTIPVQTSATANGLAAGTYVVTITDANSCSITKSVTITQPNVLAATTTQTNVSCFNGTNGSATVNVTGGTGTYSYSWNTTPAQTSATANGLSAGTYTVTITDANSCSITKSVTITQPNILAATTIQTNVSCFNGTNGSATVNVTGGTGTYSYSWNTTPAQTTATANGLSAGTYVVTITDANSCSITKSVTITQPNVLAATTTQTNVSCFNGTNGSATVIVTGGTGSYSYSWNTVPVQTSATANGLAAGTYVVTITDANSCSTTKTVTITQPNILAATTIQTNVSCFNGTNGSATVIATGGTGIYSYSWNTIPVQTSATANGLAAGTYNVTVTDANGCLIIQSFTITEPEILAVTTAQTNAGCNGASTGTATVIATGGEGDYTYSWNTVPVQTSATANGLAAGTYNVTVTDANGCSIIQSFTITEPEILAVTTAQTNAGCNGASTGTATVIATGGAGDYTYLWDTVPAQTSSTATGLATGTYTVTLTDVNGCITTASVAITQPPAIILNTQPENSNVLVGDSTTFIVNAENADSYQWEVSTNGTDWNVVSEGGNSPGYSGSATNTLTLTDISLLNNGYLYRVVLLNGADCATISSAGILTVSNNLHAFDDDFSATLINEGVGGIAGDVTLNDVFNSVIVDDSDINIAITNDGGLTGVSLANDGTLTIPANATEGTYTVTYSICDVADATNCSTAAATVVVAPPLKADGFDFTDIDIYPNPASTEVYIKIPTFSNYNNLKVNVYDIHGRLVREHLLNAEIEKVNISALEDGVYIFKISFDGGNTTKKIIKKP